MAAQTPEKMITAPTPIAKQKTSQPLPETQKQIVAQMKIQVKATKKRQNLKYPRVLLASPKFGCLCLFSNF